MSSNGASLNADDLTTEARTSHFRRGGSWIEGRHPGRQCSAPGTRASSTASSYGIRWSRTGSYAPPWWHL